MRESNYDDELIIITNMRTTINLDDDLLSKAKVFARTRGISIGKAVSELVRRGLQAPLQTRVVNGFHVIELPGGTPQVTTEQVRKLESACI
jgi:Arc/MetJ family transcription regulator